MSSIEAVVCKKLLIKAGGYLKVKTVKQVSAVLSGALLISCFPTFDLYLLAWVALVPFLVSLYDQQPKEAFISGMLMGVVYFFGTTYWIYHSLNHFGNIPFLLSLILVFFLSLYLSLYTGLFAMLFSMKITTTRLPALLIAPVFWTSLEFIRSYALTGFPWSSLGYSQYKFLLGIQFADITGIYGVSFLIVAINGAIADIFIVKKRLQDMPLFSLSRTVSGFAALGIILLFVFSYGYWRLNQHRPGNPLRVSIIQGNIEQSKKWNPEYQDEVINTYKELTTLAASSSPSLIIWPETSLPFYFGYDTVRTSDFVSFQKQLNTYLLFGSVTVKEAASGKSPALLANSAVLLDKNGNVPYIYDKIHLVPFGEYVPFRGVLFFLDKLVAGVGDFTPGGKYIKASTSSGSFSTLVCYEIIFPGLVRKFYSRDGDFIVTITNDAWFGKTTGPYQHFSIAVLRAIENRKPLIRAANTGVSGFIDSSGRILKTTPVFERMVETMDMFTDTTRSFYSKYGDIFLYLCMVVFILFLI